MNPSKPLIAAGMAAVALAVGCGDDDDSDAISKADYITRANALCEKQQARIDRAFQELSAKIGEREPTGQEAQRFVKENLPPYRAAVEERNRLPVPEGDETEVEAIVAANEKGIATLERGLTDPEAARASLQGDPLAEGNRLSAAYGVTRCGGE